jgi:hypothetical protein
MRIADDKKNPIVIDLVDAPSALFYMHRKRSKFYQSIGCTVETIGSQR